MNRTAAKMKEARRQRPANVSHRVKPGRRHGRTIAEEPSTLPRPANDVGIDLGLPEPPMGEAAFVTAVDDLPAELEPIEKVVAAVQ